MRANGPTRRNGRRGPTGGFSLIELMVVITIIGLLGGIVGVNVIKYLSKASIQATKTQIISIEDAILSYKLSHRRLPETLDQLIGDDGELNADEVPQDAWGYDFIYEPQGSREFQLYSLGADNLEGGEGEDADIDRKAAHRAGGDEE